MERAVPDLLPGTLDCWSRRRSSEAPCTGTRSRSGSGTFRTMSCRSEKPRSTLPCSACCSKDARHSESPQRYL